MRFKIAKKKNYFPLIEVGCVVFLYLILLFLSLPVYGNEERRVRISELKINKFSITSSTMEEALIALRKVDEEKIMIGFEEVPKVLCVYQRKPVKLEIKDATIKEILDNLVTQDPRYDYEIINGLLINVFPRIAKTSPNNLLNIRVFKISIHGNYFLSSLIKRPYYWIPELREFMENSIRAYKAVNKEGFNSLNEGFRAGTYWDYQSDLYQPLNFEFREKTVREILNSLVSQGTIISRNRGGKALSWKYQFIIDPDAYTGLGGYPLWGQLEDETPQKIF